MFWPQHLIFWELHQRLNSFVIFWRSSFNDELAPVPGFGNGSSKHWINEYNPQHFDSQSTEDVVLPQLVYSSTIDELHQTKVAGMHCWPGGWHDKQGSGMMEKDIAHMYINPDWEKKLQLNHVQVTAELDPMRREACDRLSWCSRPESPLPKKITLNHVPWKLLLAKKHTRGWHSWASTAGRTLPLWSV